MFYIVDIPTCDRLGLQGAEVLVFSCLAFLCRDKGYWQGSYSKLANYSLCGSPKTAERACKALFDMGVVRRDGVRFYITRQNDATTRQNDVTTRQNDAFLKESTKEKGDNIKKECVNKEGTHTHDFLNEDSFSTVDKNTAAQFGTENGIPIEVVGKWWYHCDEREWRHNDGTRIVNWQSSLQKWFLHEKQMNMRFITNGCPSRVSPFPIRGEGRVRGSTEGAALRNEMIRRQQLEQQHREREQNDREGVSMPEHLAQRFAKFGKM